MEIEKIVEELKKENILAIILYGSQIKDYKREESDIDICVVVGNADKQKVFEKILDLMQDEKLDIKIFEDLPLYIKIKVIEEGKVLYCKNELELFEYFWLIRKIWEDELISIKKLEET